MFRKLTVLLLILAAAGCQAPPWQPESASLQPQEPPVKTGQQIFKEAEYLAEIHVVMKKNGADTDVRGIGSGFLIKINNKLRVLTASHVISHPGYTLKEITVLFKGNPNSFPATVDKIGPANLDCASLKIDDPDFAFNGRLANLHLQKDFEVGDDVYSLGSPLFADFSLGKGIIRNLNFGQNRVPELKWKSVIAHDADIQPGNSGGPLLDRFGRVIGINVGTHPVYTNFGLATYIADVLDWLATQY